MMRQHNALDLQPHALPSLSLVLKPANVGGPAPRLHYRIAIYSSFSHY